MFLRFNNVIGPRPPKHPMHGIQLDIFTESFKMLELVDEYSLETLINLF